MLHHLCSRLGLVATRVVGGAALLHNQLVAGDLAGVRKLQLVLPAKLP
jgi:hypothetical protein